MPRRHRCRPVIGAALLAVLLGAWTPAASAAQPAARVAVFPVENLSGGAVPADDVRRFLIERLASAGVGVLADDALDAFMSRHRVRYAAGVDAATAGLLRKETGVNSVLIASIGLSVDSVPPKVSLIVRLVSIAAAPSVVWADDAGLSGDDAPGWFERGLVDDYQVLLTRALDRVSRSLIAYLLNGQAAPPVNAAAKFRPRSSYRRLDIEPGRSYSVAVVPFFNLSERRNAGDILALLFARHLAGFPQFRVIDAGVTRRQFLDARIIMDGGISISDAETVAGLVDADFVLGGRVLRYEDYEGPAGRTRVEFSTVLIERKSRRVVWSSESYNEGSDGVRAFERGTSRTAHAMATRMAALISRMIARGDR